MVVYESPHRIEGLLRDMLEVLGDRTVAIGRELTKLHEELAIRPISVWLSTPLVAQGEFVLLIKPQQAEQPKEANDLELVAAFQDLSRSGEMSRREAIRATAERFSVSSRQVFTAIESSKLSGE